VSLKAGKFFCERQNFLLCMPSGKAVHISDYIGLLQAEHLTNSNHKKTSETSVFEKISVLSLSLFLSLSPKLHPRDKGPPPSTVKAEVFFLSNDGYRTFKTNPLCLYPECSGNRFPLRHGHLCTRLQGVTSRITILMLATTKILASQTQISPFRS
jgi:hypothetical protein